MILLKFGQVDNNIFRNLSLKYSIFFLYKIDLLLYVSLIIDIVFFVLESTSIIVV